MLRSLRSLSMTLKGKGIGGPFQFLRWIWLQEIQKSPCFFWRWRNWIGKMLDSEIFGEELKRGTLGTHYEKIDDGIFFPPCFGAYWNMLYKILGGILSRLYCFGTYRNVPYYSLLPRRGATLFLNDMGNWIGEVLNHCGFSERHWKEVRWERTLPYKGQVIATYSRKNQDWERFFSRCAPSEWRGKKVYKYTSRNASFISLPKP